MPSNILVALSSTKITSSNMPMNPNEQESIEISRQVFDEAIELAKAFGGVLVLLHVVSDQEIHSDKQKSKDEFEQECAARLKQLEAEAAARGVDALSDQLSFKVAIGNPGKIICDYAKLWKSDLIVVGRRERHFHLLSPGSVSNDVIHNAPCTVFVVHRRSSANPEGTHKEVLHQQAI